MKVGWDKSAGLTKSHLSLIIANLFWCAQCSTHCNFARDSDTGYRKNLTQSEKWY